MLRQTNYQNMKFNPLFIVIGVLLVVAVFRTNTTGAVTTAPITINWNLQDLDVTKNGNALRALLFLETNKISSFASPSPSSVLNKPSDFYGQYLQFSGTIKSARSYSPQNNLESIIIGNSTEMIMIASDGTTIIDCFLIGNNTNPTSGVSVTVNGYSPGIRYAQNTQGGVTPELVFIGHLGTVTSTTPDASPNLILPSTPNPVLPSSSDSILPTSPNP